MDRQDTIKCLFTAVRMLMNTTERLQKQETDWEVGCKCVSEAKKVVVRDILEGALIHLGLPLNVVIKDEGVVAIISTLKKAEEDSSKSDDSSSESENSATSSKD